MEMHLEIHHIQVQFSLSLLAGHFLPCPSLPACSTRYPPCPATQQDSAQISWGTTVPCWAQGSCGCSMVKNPEPCFSPRCAPFSSEEAGDMQVTRRWHAGGIQVCWHYTVFCKLQLRAAAVHHNMSIIVVFMWGPSMTDSSYGKHSPSSDTHNHINFIVLWCLIVISVSRKRHDPPLIMQVWM